MKRLAQQEYNNMLEELQEDDNVDDDGEIIRMIYKLNSVAQLLICSYIYIYIFLNKNYITSDSRESVIRHRCKLLAIGTCEILKYKLYVFFFF